MKLNFTALATNELQSAVDYYDSINPILGDELISEVQIGLDFIKSFPLAWTKIGIESRKYTLRRFPYIILYRVKENSILIGAFAHQHRLPENFIDRP